MPRRLSLACVLGLTMMAVAIPSAAAGGGCHADPGMSMTTGSEPHVTIGECAFIDTVVHVEPGDQVTWVNEDPVPHTVSGAAFSWGDEDLLERGDEVAYAFEKEGVYPYYCALHPSMVGAVVVGDAGAAAALTNGSAAVEEVGAVGAGTGTGPAPEASTGSVPAIGLAIVATLGLVAALARLAIVRRREPSATPAP